MTSIRKSGDSGDKWRQKTPAITLVLPLSPLSPLFVSITGEIYNACNWDRIGCFYPSRVKGVISGDSGDTGNTNVIAPKFCHQSSPVQWVLSPVQWRRP
jgi:hypothetical protein